MLRFSRAKAMKFFLPTSGLARQIFRVTMRKPVEAVVLPTHTAALFEAAVQRAAEVLRRGDVAALPTETVYGLAANALDANAVAKIYEVKGRPTHNPIIVHVSDLTMARQCVAEWPEAVEKLARAFWPGPLTLVLRRAAVIPNIVTAGGDTVGIRWPQHPFMQAVIRACGFPLAAPSANVSNAVSPTNAEHVRQGIGSRISLIVDGGQSQVGLESTVLDLTVTPARVLRPGMIHAGAIRAVLGDGGLADASDNPGTTLKSPGLLAKHYSPKAKLVVLAWADEAQLREGLRERGVETSRAHVMAHSHIPGGEGWGGVSVIPHDAEAYARALYAELHRCDELDAGWIIVEQPPDGPEWAAVADRLARAASGTAG
jgi:L-threonylcarbamoyladenylate synthase